MTPKLFYLKYISDHIDTCLYPYQGKELFYQQIKDLKRVSEICEADTVIKILVLLLQEPDHCYVIPAAQVVLYPFFRVVYSFVAMGLETSNLSLITPTNLIHTSCIRSSIGMYLTSRSKTVDKKSRSHRLITDNHGHLASHH